MNLFRTPILPMPGRGDTPNMYHAAYVSFIVAGVLAPIAVIMESRVSYIRIIRHISLQWSQNERHDVLNNRQVDG